MLRHERPGHPQFLTFYDSYLYDRVNRLAAAVIGSALDVLDFGLHNSDIARRHLVKKSWSRLYRQLRLSGCPRAVGGPVWRIFLILLLASIIGLSSGRFGADHGGAKAYSIAKSQVGKLAAVDQGRAIFKVGDRNIERLRIWDIEARRISSEVALRAWGQWSQRAPQELQVGQDILQDIFRIQRSGRKLVAVQVPWVVLIDLQKHVESRRVLTSKAYLEPNVTAPSLSDDLPEQSVMAMSPADDSVVVALNLNDETTLFLYSADLELKARWSVPRYVRSLCWSPDGRTLAILYAARYDDRRRPVSGHFGEISPEPDVWLCDASTGKATSKFSTGSSENQTLFSNDGKRLYAINTWMYWGGRMGWGVIRVFDIPSGTLLQTIRGPKHGIHGRMDLSSDGKFIAADATTEQEDIFRSLLGFETVSKVTSRIVVLEQATGKLVFELRSSIGAHLWKPLCFGFSADGGLLLADMSRADGTVDAYPIGQR